MNSRHWIWIGLLVLVSLGLQWLGTDHAAGHAWENIPFFFPLFSFFGCLLLIWVAKGLGKRLLQRPEDYYDRDR
jgi:hypothetical protein